MGAIPWSYMSKGPFVIERYDPRTHELVGDITHHVGFVQAMQAFWADHASPGLRTVIDSRGVMIVGQVLGREWESPMTEEVALYLQMVIPPDVWEMLSWLPQAASWIAETECTR